MNKSVKRVHPYIHKVFAKLVLKVLRYEFCLEDVLFMFKKIRIMILIFSCMTILFIGLIKINAAFPWSSTDKASMKVSYTLKPFDFKIETKNFSMQVNGECFSDIKEKSKEILKKIEEKKF